jgi:hypothetical protein
MKKAINVGVILGLGLLAFGGARALPAAEVIGDGQEQARLLLSGGGASLSGREPRLASLSSSSATSVALDGQEQGREMILGRQRVKAPNKKASELRASGARRDHRFAGDPHEMARRMILGSQSAGSLAKIRLAGKAE